MTTNESNNILKYIPNGSDNGYHSDDIKSDEVIDELRDLRTIRRQCNRIFELGKNNKLNYFTLNLDNIDTAAKAVISTINRDYPNFKIPMHSRFRHYPKNMMESIYKSWNNKEVEKKEQTRRLIDLTTISVLLDAGAGANWNYVDENGNKYTRSEGLAAASVDMFKSGIFSSDNAIKHRVNSCGLEKLKVEDLKRGFQVSKVNKMTGLDGRCNLLVRLSKALKGNTEYFGKEIHRPGHILDYLLKNCDENNCVSIRVLWKAIVVGLESIWPEKLSGIRKGDVWNHNSLKIIGKPGSDLVPFHKLQQWLTYSLMECLINYGIKFKDTQDMTALAEYRNGGLLIDTGVINIKKNVDKDVKYDVGSELVVEWRALTIVLIDKVAAKINKLLNKHLPLAMILEGGTWQCGRDMAFKKREGLPPLVIRSDGTVF